VYDEAGFGEYREKVAPLIVQYGGRMLAVGPASEKEGRWGPETYVPVEFPNIERAQEWYDCSDYQLLKQLRRHSARVNPALIEGM
jgi:uncharacterized protein (DUF1330 family)